MDPIQFIDYLKTQTFLRKGRDFSSIGWLVSSHYSFYAYVFNLVLVNGASLV